MGWRGAGVRAAAACVISSEINALERFGFLGLAQPTKVRPVSSKCIRVRSGKTGGLRTTGHKKGALAPRRILMGAFSIWHLLILGAIALVLFGGRGKVSDLMGDFGKGINSFKKGLSDGKEEARALNAETSGAVVNKDKVSA
jgi:sec-independent protein translocase protein TatA